MRCLQTVSLEPSCSLASSVVSVARAAPTCPLAAGTSSPRECNKQTQTELAPPHNLPAAGCANPRVQANSLTQTSLSVGSSRTHTSHIRYNYRVEATLNSALVVSLRPHNSPTCLPRAPLISMCFANCTRTETSHMSYVNVGHQLEFIPI